MGSGFPGEEGNILNVFLIRWWGGGAGVKGWGRRRKYGERIEIRNLGRRKRRDQRKRKGQGVGEEVLERERGVKRGEGTNRWRKD